jgi:hypothetical protein
MSRPSEHIPYVAKMMRHLLATDSKTQKNSTSLAHELKMVDCPQVDAFTGMPMHGVMLPRSGSAMPKGLRAPVVAKRSCSVALRMQSEDEKAKAAGAALALFGFTASGFSVFVAVILGGAGIYAAKLPEEGDKGISDTAKQVSLLIGTYSLKAFEFVKAKDAEEGYSKKMLQQIKGVVADAKSKIEK